MPWCWFRSIPFAIACLIVLLLDQFIAEYPACVQVSLLNNYYRNNYISEATPVPPDQLWIAGC